MNERVDDRPAGVEPGLRFVGGEDVLKDEDHAKYDIDGIDDEVNFIGLKQLLDLKTQLVLLNLIIDFFV